METKQDTAAAQPSDLTSKTVSGLSWTALATGLGFAMQMGYQAVVNRLLDPVAFGLMALALVVMQFSKYFATMGVSQALIHKAELDDEDIRVAFTSSVLLGLTVAAALWFAAPTVERFFAMSGLTPVVRAMGALVLVLSCRIVADALLRRRMGFRQVALIQMSGYLVGFLGVGIGLAALGAGVWSLVGAYLSAAVWAGVNEYRATRHRVLPLLRWGRLRSLYGYGGRVSVIQVLEFIGTQLDTVAVGRYMTAALTGQYSRAYLITQYPMNKLTHAVSQVLFPGFSRIQHDLARMRRAYLQSVGPAAFVLVPTCAGLAVAAPEIVLGVLGPQWDVAAGIVPVLAIGIAFALLSRFGAVLAQALAELNKKLAVQLTFLAVLLGLLALARGHGLLAYAAALTTAEAVRFLLYQVLTRRLLAIRYADLAKAYAPAAMAAAAIAATIAAGRYVALAAELPLVAVLAVELTLGAVSLVAVLRFGPVPQLRRQLRQRLQAAGVAGRPGPVGKLVGATLGE